MKSSKVVGWVALLNLSMLLACGGVSSIGSGAEAGTSAAGAKTGGSPGTVDDNGGAAHVGGANTAGKPSGATAGTGAMPGAGASSGVECWSDTECTGWGEDCQACADGSTACTRTYCEVSKGRCFTSGSTCDAECSSDQDCPLACTGCRDGSQACATRQCVMGTCRESSPATCGAGTGMCQASADCGPPPPVCVECVDGSCASFDCVNHQCAWNCPLSKLQCQVTEDCPSLHDGQCTLCSNGTCAVVACIQNACELVCPVK